MPKMGLSIIVLIIFSFLLFGGESVNSYEVAGVVTNSETGEPLAYAGIIILSTDFMTITNANGFYYFPDVPPGSYTFMIGRDDYQTKILTSVGIGWICGDVDGDMNINILDVVYLINYKYKGGPPPNTLASADVNSDGGINILDVVYIVNFKYKGGPTPVCP